MSIKDGVEERKSLKNVSRAKLQISDSVRDYILSEYVEYYFKRDVQDAFRDRTCWKITGQIFETISKIFVTAGGILSFSSGYYNDPKLSFIAGSVATVSLACLQFASFCYKENRKNTTNLNTMLEMIGIQSIPELQNSVDIPPQTGENKTMARKVETTKTPSPVSTQNNSEEDCVKTIFEEIETKETVAYLVNPLTNKRFLEETKEEQMAWMSDRNKNIKIDPISKKPLDQLSITQLLEYIRLSIDFTIVNQSNPLAEIV
jgi:hypothetical protein